MDADLLEETLALLILGYGKDGSITIPKGLIDAFEGRHFELIHSVDQKKEEITFKLIFIDTNKELTN